MFYRILAEEITKLNIFIERISDAVLSVWLRFPTSLITALLSLRPSLERRCGNTTFYAILILHNSLLTQTIPLVTHELLTRVD